MGFSKGQAEKSLTGMRLGDRAASSVAGAFNPGGLVPLEGAAR